MDDLRETIKDAIRDNIELFDSDLYGASISGHEEATTAVLAAIEASGYKIVPVEPTEEMMDAGLPHIPLIGEADRHNVADVWEAMLTAYGQKGTRDERP